MSASHGGNGTPAGIAPELWRAYLTTTYRVHAPDGDIDLRIGQPVPELDDLLASFGESNWAFVSAANPASKQLSVEENDERHERLRAEVDGLGLRALEGAGVDPGGGWPAERSLLIVGIEPDSARALGRRFAQNAVVVGLHGGPPVLISCLAS